MKKLFIAPGGENHSSLFYITFTFVRVFVHRTNLVAFKSTARETDFDFILLCSEAPISFNNKKYPNI